MKANGRHGHRWPRTNIHVVCGPPCSGKTTFIRDSKSDGDVVVDLDALAVALGSGADHCSEGDVLQVAFDVRRAAIESVLKRDCTAWIIHTQPTARQMGDYERSGVVVHLIDPGIDECLARAARDGRPQGTADAIRKWYTTGGAGFDHPARKKSPSGKA